MKNWLNEKLKFEIGKIRKSLLDISKLKSEFWRFFPLKMTTPLLPPVGEIKGVSVLGGD